jgi:hypothetical protein
MKFRTEVIVTSTEYRASSPDSNFARSGPAICMTIRPNNTDLFLSIAEGEDAFRDDPKFQRLKTSGELRIFNPFDPMAFQPENAASVIRFFIGQAHRQLRARFPSFIREFCELFLDRCNLTLRIAGFYSLPLEAQTAFRNGIQSIRSVTAFTIEHDRNTKPFDAAGKS